MSQRANLRMINMKKMRKNVFIVRTLKRCTKEQFKFVNI